MSISYSPKTAILDHFFMTTLLIFLLRNKKSKIIKCSENKALWAILLVSKMKTSACQVDIVLIKYCKYIDNIKHVCNTLSGGAEPYGQNTRPEANRSFSKKEMLDDQATCRSDELFHSFGSQISGPNRLFQQFYPQREMVHSGIDSPFQHRRPVVLPRYRFFKAWSTDPHPCEPGRKECFGDDSRSTGEGTSVPLPCCPGSIVPKGQPEETKTWSFLRIFVYRSGQSRRSGENASTTSYASTGGVGSADPCSVHPDAQFGFRTPGQNDFSKNRDSDQRRAGSKTFQDAWFKKNGLNSGAKALVALKQNITRLYHNTLPGQLFPDPPVIRFRPEDNRCTCGTSLLVQKTRQKKVFCMTGPFTAHETLYHCKECRQVYHSKKLQKIVARHCNVGWDILVFVGKSLFQRHQTTDQVCHELRFRNIGLSSSEIEYLGRKFILYLALAHRQATPRIEQAMRRSGGYILHLDATHEGDAPALMTGMDGLSQIVLANVKIPSEHADNIVPFLQQLQKNYGSPIACVHDMGTGICKAVARVFPGTRDFVCHFHFLRDAGKDILNPSYGQLRKTLQRHAATTRLGEIVRDVRRRIDLDAVGAGPLTDAIRDGHAVENIDQTSLFLIYSLCLWCLQGKKDGNGYGFPFDRPLLAFACRISNLHHSLPILQKRILSKDRIGNRLFSKLFKLIENICADSDFIRPIADLEWRTQLFDDLRGKMRIAEPAGRNGLNDDGTEKSMNCIKNAVGMFRSKLGKNALFKKDVLCRKLAKQIDKYDDRLFADPIEINTPSGTMSIYPQRTNNILEQFFRSLRRNHRKKTGNNSMRRVLHAMLADTPLIKNLEKPEYMNMLLNGKESLEELFAQLESTGHDLISSTSHTDRILPGFRRLIKMDNLPEKIQLALEKCA